ncbi:MAG TPA: transcription elongation factor Spt5 [Thermoplasmata archaeon]|nr:transcription elongation factor Spt5 [Thermoplasmata archaeon]
MAGNPPEEGIGLLSGPSTPSAAEVKSAAPASPPVAAVVEPAPVIKAAPAGLLSLKAADDVERFVTADTVTTLSAVLTSGHHEPGLATLHVEVAYTSKYPGEGAEWPVSWMPPGKRSFLPIVAAKTKAGVTLTPGVGVPVTFEVTAPVGIRFGDRLEIRITAAWEEGGNGAKLTLACVGRQAVLAIKTSRGYEREVADTLLTRAEEKPDVVFALLVPAALRGYVFAEGMSAEGVRELLKGIRKARGLVDGETTLKEVEPLLVPRVTVEGFVEGAIVELIAGPFKGEKARVKKIDQGKEEITVELIEAVVPIPVTVRGDHVRMLEKGGGKSGG